MTREDFSVFSKNPTLPRRDWQLEEIEDRGEPSKICECCGVKPIRYVHHLRHQDVDASLEVGSECAKDLLRDPALALEADRVVRNFAARRENFTTLSNWRMTADRRGDRLRKDGFIFTVKQGRYGGWAGAARIADSSGRDWPFSTPFYKTADAAKLAIFDAVYLPTLKGPAIARAVAHTRDGGMAERTDAPPDQDPRAAQRRR
jgi:hypothetical protein